MHLCRVTPKPLFPPDLLIIFYVDCAYKYDSDRLLFVWNSIYRLRPPVAGH